MEESISDIHLCERTPGESLSFPGPRKIPSELDCEIFALMGLCKSMKKADFMITHNGSFYRGRREERAVDGTWYQLRRMPPVAPTLETMPSKLPLPLVRMLMSPYLASGGLVYVTGAPGVGKTTTASAAVISRLKEFGGFAYTVEDPPEMPLNGWHEKGYCRQTWVAGDTSSDWAESFRGVLRSQPVGTSVILFVGEVRDGESARAMLRAANNGFLVIATGFGTDIVSGLSSLVQTSGADPESFLSSLSNVLRLVVHQRLNQKQVVATSLANRDSASSVAARIRRGELTHLNSDIQFQANLQINGSTVF